MGNFIDLLKAFVVTEDAKEILMVYLRWIIV